MQMEEAIRVVLDALGITQKELEERIGIGQSQISNALNGRNKTALNKIYHYLVHDAEVDMSKYVPDFSHELPAIKARLDDMQLQLNEILSILHQMTEE